jgi:8-oxo-dGTP pyrophosphatase MutT (NUDIX family)
LSDSKKWRVTSSETLIEYKPWMTVVRQSVSLPNGAVIPDYLLAFERDYSMIVALTADDEVLVVRQYKHGIGSLLREFPAGYIDEGESPADAAKRELLEETGYKAHSWTALGAFCISPNRGPASAHFFLAHDAALVRGPKLDATEDLSCELVPAERVDAMLRSGAMPSLSNAAAWGLAMAAHSA